MSGPLGDEKTEVMARPAPPWRRWAGAAALSMALAALAWQGGRALAGSRLTGSVFKVRAIEVSGLSRTPRDEALATAGLAMHQSILRVPLKQGVEALESLPWVRRAAIRRQLPDRLRVDVVEHTASLAVQLGELWWVNPDGEPFKRFSARDHLVLPMVTGLHAQPPSERAYAEQPLLVAQLREALALHDALSRIRDDLFNVEELHHDPDMGWSAVVLLGRAQKQSRQSRVSVTAHLGKRPIERLPMLVASLTELADRRLVPRTIWAANGRQAGRVQVELASAP